MSVGLKHRSTNPHGIEELYKDAHRLLLRMRADLDQLESKRGGSVAAARSTASIGIGESSGKADSEDLLSRLMVDVNVLSRKSGALEPLLVNLPPAKKQLWNIKTRQLSTDCKELRSCIDRHLRVRNAAERDKDERRRLFGDQSPSAPSSEMEQLFAESNSLSSANRMLSELEAVGDSVVEALVGQNEMIKSMHRRVMDVGNTLGLSRSLMRMIEKRQFFDKLLVYGGMTVVLFILFLAYRYS